MPATSAFLRRTVFGAALALTLIVSSSLRPPQADAQTQGAPNPAAAAAPSKDAPPANAENNKADEDQHTVVIERGGKRVRVIGLGEPDRDYDSVDSFIKHEPELAGMVVAVVSVVFLSPVLVIWLVLRHRMRKAQLLNETMVQLAERGVVPPAEAMQALGAGHLPPSVTEPIITSAGGTAATVPSLLDQARQARRRAAWSDLRKGVLIGAIGLAFTTSESINNGAPGAFGLLLLFIGLAYCGLWWYETRQIAPAPVPPGTPGDGR